MTRIDLDIRSPPKFHALDHIFRNAFSGRPNPGSYLCFSDEDMCGTAARLSSSSHVLSLSKRVPERWLLSYFAGFEVWSGWLLQMLVEWDVAHYDIGQKMRQNMCPLISLVLHLSDDDMRTHTLTHIYKHWRAHAHTHTLVNYDEVATTPELVSWQDTISICLGLR